MGKEWNIGQFTEVVEFLRPIRSLSNTGARNTSYETAGKRYCQLDEISLEPKEVQSALAEDEQFILKTWNVTGANTEWRVKYNDKTYDIIKSVKKKGSITFYTIRRTDLCNE